jgi:hypothetical protein
VRCLLRSHVVAARGSSPLMLGLWRPTRVPDHLFYTETCFSDAWSRCFTGRSIVCPLTPRRLVRRPGFEDFPCRRNRAMCVLIASGALSSGDQKEHTNTESNHATEPAETSLSGRSVNRPGTLATNLKTKRTVAATAKSEAKGGREHPASRAQSPRAETWFADTAAAMILRRRSRSDATRAATPASRNAMEPKNPASEPPEPTERQSPQSSWSRQWKHAVWQTETRNLPLSVAVRKVCNGKSRTFSPLIPAN